MRKYKNESKLTKRIRLRKQRKRIKKLSFRVALLMILSVLINPFVTLKASSTPENIDFILGDIATNVEEFTTEDGALKIKRTVERVSDKELKVSMDIKNNLEPLLETREINVNEEKLDEQLNSELEQQEEVAKEPQVETVEVQPIINNIILNEILSDSFSIVDDSMEVNGVENKDLFNIDKEKKEIEIIVGNIEAEEVTVSYTVILSDETTAGENMPVAEKTLVKYSTSLKNEETSNELPKILVSVKDVVIEESSDNSNDKEQSSEEVDSALDNGDDEGEVKDEAIEGSDDVTSGDEVVVDKNETQEEDDKEIVEGDQRVEDKKGEITNEEEQSEKEYSTFEIEHVENQALNVTADMIDFPITIRDFKGDFILFETIQKNLTSGGNSWLGSGMVEANLGTNKKPIFQKGTIDKLASYLWNNKTNIRDTVNNLNSQSYPYKTEILDRINLIINNVQGYGDYDSAVTWYNTVKDKEYNDVKNEVNTAYRYIYYHMNKFFEDTTTDKAPNLDRNKKYLNIKDDRIAKKITLKNTSGDIYSFDSNTDAPYDTNDGFFSVDGLGFGNEGYKNSGNKSHNFHFSLESHSRFWIPKKGDIPQSGLTFTFRGDDDVWVYVNNQLVIDLGGIHGAEEARFKVIQSGNNISIVKEKKTGSNWVSAGNDIVIQNGNEKWVDFDFFYMERHTTESNLKVETNIKFIPNMTVEKQAFLIDDKGNERILNNNDFVYPGETVYYKFTLKNKGNVNLTDIIFEDDTLDVIVNKNGVYNKSTGALINYNDLTIFKNGEVIDSDKLNALAELPLAQGNEATIEIKSKDFLKYTVKESDIPNGSLQGKITNRVIAKATYTAIGQGVLQDSSEATVTVIPRPITEEIIKLDATIVKIIDKILRDDTVIYQSNDKSVPNILPGDVITFKFEIVNNSSSRSSGIGGNITWVPIAIEGLKLDDQLTIGDSYTKTDLAFYKLDDTNKIQFTNYDNFKLEKQETLIVYSDWVVTDDEANHYKYTLDKDVTNKVELFKVGGLPETQYPDNTKKLGESQVQLKIQPPSLKVQKVISNNSLQDFNTNRTFTITVKGSNGTQYNIEAEKGKEYTLDNLKYGVNYTVSEIVPMNYQCEGVKFYLNNADISDNTISSKNTIMLTAENIGATAIVTNKKSNDNFWFDDARVTNIFRNTSSTASN